METLIGMVNTLANNLNVEISNPDICDIYSIKGKSDKKTIIVELNSKINKDNIIKSAKTYNIQNKTKRLGASHLGFDTNADSPIFINERLTPKASRLYFLARDLKKSKGYKHCWPSNGRIYVRKTDDSPVIWITSESQVQLLFNEWLYRILCDRICDKLSEFIYKKNLDNVVIKFSIPYPNLINILFATLLCITAPNQPIIYIHLYATKFYYSTIILMRSPETKIINYYTIAIMFYQNNILVRLQFTQQLHSTFHDKKQIPRKYQYTVQFTICTPIRYNVDIFICLHSWCKMIF